jgi:hypothetical protein
VEACPSDSFARLRDPPESVACHGLQPMEVTNIVDEVKFEDETRIVRLVLENIVSRYCIRGFWAASIRKGSIRKSVLGSCELSGRRHDGCRRGERMRDAAGCRMLIIVTSVITAWNFYNRFLHHRQGLPSSSRGVSALRHNGSNPRPARIRGSSELFTHRLIERFRVSSHEKTFNLLTHDQSHVPSHTWIGSDLDSSRILAILGHIPASFAAIAMTNLGSV